MLKTPKQLDSSFFDGQVLPPPSSATPRLPKIFRNYRRRLPIPKTPTDLSWAKKIADLQANMDVDENEAAEDLSVNFRKVNKAIKSRINEEIIFRFVDYFANRKFCSFRDASKKLINGNRITFLISFLKVHWDFNFDWITITFLLFACCLHRFPGNV